MRELLPETPGEIRAYEFGRLLGFGTGRQYYDIFRARLFTEDGVKRTWLSAVGGLLRPRMLSEIVNPALSLIEEEEEAEKEHLLWGWFQAGVNDAFFDGAGMEELGWSWE